MWDEGTEVAMDEAKTVAPVQRRLWRHKCSFCKCYNRNTVVYVNCALLFCVVHVTETLIVIS